MTLRHGTYALPAALMLLSGLTVGCAVVQEDFEASFASADPSCSPDYKGETVFSLEDLDHAIDVLVEMEANQFAVISFEPLDGPADWDDWPRVVLNRGTEGQRSEGGHPTYTFAEGTNGGIAAFHFVPPPATVPQSDSDTEDPQRPVTISLLPIGAECRVEPTCDSPARYSGARCLVDEDCEGEYLVENSETWCDTEHPEVPALGNPVGWCIVKKSCPDSDVLDEISW